MNERLAELRQLWNKHFDGELTPAENARLSELMADAPLMEAFAAEQAKHASAEPESGFSDEAWKALDAKVMAAFRRRQSGAWLKPLMLALGAGLAIAGGAYWFNSSASQDRPALGTESEAFTAQEALAGPKTNSPKDDGSHEIHASWISVVVDQAKSGPASVEVRSASGAMVRELFSGELEAGKHRFEWNGMDGHGRKASPGGYSFVIKNSAGTETREFEVRARKP